MRKGILCYENVITYSDQKVNFSLIFRNYVNFLTNYVNKKSSSVPIFPGVLQFSKWHNIPDNGEIVAVLIDNEATLKRVKPYDGHISPELENPKSLVYWGEERNTVRILGKAVVFTSAIQ